MSHKGHTDEINCVKFYIPLVVSGSSDKSVRLWSLADGGVCLRVLHGHEGKVWSVDIDRNRIVSGGRHGEIRIWSLKEVMDTGDREPSVEADGRSLWVHARSTAVGQIRIYNALLISCDGVGRVVMSDFWNLVKKTACGCSTSK